MAVIDVHTHMLSLQWIELLRASGGRYTVKKNAAREECIYVEDAQFMTLFPGMWDYDLRIRKMDEAGVDIAIVSLTCPNVYWGDAATSLRAAQLVNDSMAEQQRLRSSRIAWIASLPWQFPDLAIQELARAVAAGAVGVMVLANIGGRNLTDPFFARVWQEIDRLALTVLVHPTMVQGMEAMDLGELALAGVVGFTWDTTLAFTRMIFDGFFDRYTKLRLIASHGGGTLPYVAGRLDRCFEKIPACSAKIKEKPSNYLQRIYYDTVVYETAALELCLKVAGDPDNLLFGSDYPHNIGDMSGCLARVRTLPEDQVQRITHKNAERIFKM